MFQWMLWHFWIGLLATSKMWANCTCEPVLAQGIVKSSYKATRRRPVGPIQMHLIVDSSVALIFWQPSLCFLSTILCSAQILQINKPSSECMSLSWWEVEREVGMFCKASKLLLLQPPHIYPRFGVFEPFCRGPLQIVLIVQMQMQWINNKTGKSTPVWEE